VSSSINSDRAIFPQLLTIDVDASHYLHIV